jgi:hypothetical protein
LKLGDYVAILIHNFHLSFKLEGVKLMFSRRDFIKALGVLGAAILNPFHRWSRPQDVQAASIKDELLQLNAELYGQFLLLPEGMPVPAFVEDYKFGIPTMCGMADETTAEKGQPPKDPITAVYSDLDSAASLSIQAGLPVYTLDKLPAGIVPSGVDLIQHKTGQLFGGDVRFEAYDEQEDTWYTAINISVQADFPKPFPLWSSTPLEPDGLATVLEKVDFTPGHHGILVRTPQGFALHWIHEGTYFLMTGDRMPDIDVRELASALVLAS